VQKRRQCWHCNLNGQDILDKFGCCKRCGTNLLNKKRPVYPDLRDETICAEVLGQRKSIKPGDKFFSGSLTLPLSENKLEELIASKSRNYNIKKIGTRDTSGIINRGISGLSFSERKKQRTRKYIYKGWDYAKEASNKI
jgi:hypothetical protein